ncbi:MAG: hypothetical protein QNI95_01615 [Desulfobacterales bacterium]|nr:hypothetical protein [Desulfobacterales bacterium]
MRPLKVKIFSHCTQNINIPNELQINAWLQAKPDIEIVNMLQSESMDCVGEKRVERNLTISVFYREK